MPKIVIFRTGRHTSMQGDTLDFSEADMTASCAAYDPVVHEAPLVVGHPKDTAPAYGWVQGLAMDGADVAADCDQVNPDFAELVKGGAFKKVSASWYAPNHPANPKPGVYYLRHVGFLGAQPPAIKGLKAVDFAEDDGEVVTIEFAEVRPWQRASGWRSVAALFRGLRDMLVEQQGAEKAEAMLPAYSIDNLLTLSEAEANADAPDSPAFSEPQQTEEPPVGQNTQPDAAELKRQADELARQQADFAEKQTAFRRDQNAAFLDGLVAQGRPLPIPKDNLLNFMEAISANALVVDFAEGKKPVADTFREILKAIPATVDFSERAPGTPGEDPDAAEDPSDVANRALDYQESQRAKGIIISTTDAVAYVEKERKK